jgi:hypothetical protein
MQTTQKSSSKTWFDESGTQVPYSRTTKAERLKERSADSLLKKAFSANKQLKELKKLIKTVSEKVLEETLKEKGVENLKSKGNYTWHNFNRTIKVEVNINEPISFDDITITAAKEKFYEFLNKYITSKNMFVKQMILDAFETQRSNKLDVKRVLNLVRYKDSIADPLFTKAVDLINQSVRRPKTKTYYRVWVMNEAGEYDNIDLNLSSI